ncbi:MAG: NUDIX hydrolase [Jiangellaceae bacterium]|nr:NUDIX hydrolase [Jiangellaceae bacterium]
MADVVSATAQQTVVAAGAVVWRPAPDGNGIEVCLVHRPKYDDWSLPKGKVDPGEHILTCAVREVAEETGQQVVLGRPLPTLHYQADGVPKRVHYWAARADDGAPAWRGTKEIDHVVIVPAVEAVRRLTHTRDAEVVEALLAGPVRTTTLVVLRHTEAVDRSAWDRPDADRPLSSDGEQAARALIAPLRALGGQRVVSSDAVRCVDSVRPFANASGLPIEMHPELTEEGHRARPHAAATLTRRLLAGRTPTVICSHRPVLPDIVAAAVEQAPDAAPAERLHPGEFLVFHHRGGVPVAVERFGP